MNRILDQTTAAWRGGALLLALLLVTCGCQRNVYEIELQPDRESLDRKLVFWRENADGDGSLSAYDEADLRRIAALYGQAATNTGAVKHDFQRKFQGRTPDDVGGSGYYVHWSTSLGATSGYIEEFRGDGDLVAEFERRQKAFDRLVDHLLAWLKSEYAQEPHFDEIAQLVDVELRGDVRNIAAWVWAYGVTSPDKPLQHEVVAARLEMYLARRGYVAPDELPAWRRAFSDMNDQQPGRLLELLQRLVASKLGHLADKPPPEWLAWMTDLPRLEASLEKYLSGTPEYTQALAAWEKKRKEDPEAAKPRTQDVVPQMVLGAILPEIHLDPDDHLSIKLLSGVEPFATNGQWQAAEGQVVWKAELLPRGIDARQSPRLAFALWSKPNDEAQKKHLGKVALDGTKLAEYCFWHRGLTPAESAGWDKLVASLDGDADSWARLRAFRFAGGDASSPPGALLETPRRLLLPPE